MKSQLTTSETFERIVTVQITIEELTAMIREKIDLAGFDLWDSKIDGSLPFDNVIDLVFKFKTTGGSCSEYKEHKL